MRWVRLLVASVMVVGCTGASSPATTPTSVLTTSSTTTTTTTLATTTTVDRLAEIEAIYQDLEERRLDALYRGDEEAFRALFANEAYMERSMGAFDVVEFDGPPGTVRIEVLAVLRDDTECLVANVATDDSATFGPDGVGTLVEVLQPIGPGAWGYAYGGEGWLCDGPHPLES